MVPRPTKTPGSTTHRPAPRQGHAKVSVGVARQIVEEITRQALEPGSRLPTEAQMLTQYGVARGTLRESLRILEINGVVAMKPGPNGGPLVARPDGHNLADALGLYLETIGARFASIVELRRALEPVITARAAAAMTDDRLDELRASVEAMEGFAEDGDERFFAENRRFHELIAQASGDAFFALLISSLHFITDGTMVGVAYPLKRRKAIVRAHAGIVDQLAARDPDAAAEAMTTHMDEFSRYVTRHYPEMLVSPLRWRYVAPRG